MHEYVRNDRIINVLSILAFIFIILALTIIAKTPPASGYEISIYNAYSLYFWVFLIASITCGIGVLVHQAFAKERSRWWLISLFIIIFTNLIIILLPIFRGYFISSTADEITHLGMIKDIILTGRAGEGNYYPISHILAFQLSSICGLDSRLAIKIIPSVFYLIYMAGLYLLARKIEEKFGQALLVMAFASVLLFTYFNYLFLPTQFFLSLIPLILMSLCKKNIFAYNLDHTMVFLIMILPMPFLHPLGSVFLILIFLLFELSILIHHFWIKRSYMQSTATTPYPSKIALVSALVVFLIFFTWFSAFAIFRITVRQAYEWFAYGHETPPIETIAEQLQMAGFTVLDFIDLLIKNYGQGLIFILLSLIAIFIILKKLQFRNVPKVEEIFFSLFFLIFSVFYIYTLFGDFIHTGRSLRIYCWALTASTVLNGVVFHEWISKLKDKRFKICIYLLTIIIIIAAIIGVFNVYYSPYIKVATPQTTKMDFDGMEWFFKHKNSDGTIYFDELPIRAPCAIFGFDMPKPKTVGRFSQGLSHLPGYDDNRTLAHLFDSDVYIVVSERVKEIKTKLWPDIGSCTLNDLNRLSFDSAVSEIYFNGELEIWQVSTAKR